jgi:uncharacterized protein (TIGR02996 family)
MSGGADRGAELLAGVIAAPDDDAPRLAYAAWLTAQGDPQGQLLGELIDVQCRLAGHRPNPQRRAELAERERELSKSLRKAFAAEVKKTADHWEIRRGFIDEIRAEAGKLLAGWRPLFAAQPIRRLTLRSVTVDHVRALVDTGVIGRLVNLGLHGKLDKKGVRILAEASDLAAIRKLNLAGCRLGDDGVAELLASPHLACTQLTLRENDISDEGAQALADAPALAQCRALFLARNQLGDESVAALAGSAHLAGLEQLGLGGNEGITDEGMEHLLAPGLFPHMRRLELEMLELEDSRDALRERWGAHVRF